jgi:hypothetical protein
MPVFFVELQYILTDTPVGLSANSVYWHYSSNNWNKNLHKNFKNSSQQVTLHLYIQYSALLALFTLCLVLLSTDTILKHSTSQILSHNHSTLYVTSAKSRSLSTTHWLTVTWPYPILLSAGPIYVAYSLSQTFFAIPVSTWYNILKSSNNFDVGLR